MRILENIIGILTNFSFALFCSLYYWALLGVRVRSENKNRALIFPTVILMICSSVLPLYDYEYVVEELIGHLVSLIIFAATIGIFTKKVPKISAIVISYIISASILFISLFIPNVITEIFVREIEVGATGLELWYVIGVAISFIINSLVYMVIKRLRGQDLTK